jgi:hypothetical protein
VAGERFGSVHALTVPRAIIDRSFDFLQVVFGAKLVYSMVFSTNGDFRKIILLCLIITSMNDINNVSERIERFFGS